MEINKEVFNFHLERTLEMLRGIKREDPIDIFYMKVFETVNEFKKAFPEECFKAPVKIRGVVRAAMGVDIVATNLNNNHISYFYQDRILLSEHLSDDMMRYALAHELSVYLINLANNKVNSHLYQISLFLEKRFEEFIAETMACYFIVPTHELLDMKRKFNIRIKSDEICGDIQDYEFYYVDQFSYYFQIPSYKAAQAIMKINDAYMFFYLKMLNEKQNESDNDLYFGKDSFYREFVRDFEIKYKEFFFIE